MARGDRRTRPALRDLLQHLQAVRLRHRHPSQHRRLRAAARAGREARAGRAHRAARALAGARAHRQEGAGATACRPSSASTTAARPGLIFGRAGEAEFADEIVNRADMVALRRKVVATVDDAIDEAAADVTAVLADGRRVHVRIEHAIGSLQRPLSDAQLEAKFAALVDPVLGAAKVEAIGQTCRELPRCLMCASSPCNARHGIIDREAPSRSGEPCGTGRSEGCARGRLLSACGRRREEGGSRYADTLTRPSPAGRRGACRAAREVVHASQSRNAP